jgi:hypothetical protein
LVASAISSLLRRRAVVTQAVGLDHKPQVRPEKVNTEAIEMFARERHRQPRLRRERQKESLKLRVGKAERTPVEQLTQPSNAPSPLIPLEPDAKLIWIDEIEPIRLVHRPLNLGFTEPPPAPATAESREINESQNRFGHWDPSTPGEVPVLQPGASVSAHSRHLPPSPGRARNRNFERTRPLRPDSPKRGGTAMAQRRIPAACEHCCHPSAERSQLRTTDGIHPAHHAVQPPDLEPMLDRVPAQPQLQELPSGDNPMLPSSKFPNRFRRLAT